jgi:hypothetical protein
VPHCFGWLRSMRAATGACATNARSTGLTGDNPPPGPGGFIDRNYACDERGCWYFQNGPQRVYVHLEGCPHPADRAGCECPGTVAHPAYPGRAGHLDAAWMDENGRLYLRSGNIIAGVDDRDLATLLPCLHHAGQADEEPCCAGWRALRI